MDFKSRVKKEADTLLDLLIGQCEDLESLLELSRREHEATARLEFEEVFRVTSERATIGERLEVCHRQISDLKGRLGQAATPIMESETGLKITELVGTILAQDQSTAELLSRTRTEMIIAKDELGKRQRGLNAYLQEGKMPSVACDQLA